VLCHLLSEVRVFSLLTLTLRFRARQSRTDLAQFAELRLAYAGKACVKLGQVCQVCHGYATHSTQSYYTQSFTRSYTQCYGATHTELYAETYTQLHTPTHLIQSSV